eukprot:Sspe_Gene.111330::Locus_93347_Transcript_1_1_Confidence_1.000_Length_1685::g.111330::m.111330
MHHALRHQLYNLRSTPPRGRLRHRCLPLFRTAPLRPLNSSPQPSTNPLPRDHPTPPDVGAAVPSPPSSPPAAELPEPEVVTPAMIRSVAVLSLSQFLSNASFGIIIPMLPQFASELGLSAWAVGTLLSAPAMSRMVLNVRMGRAADSIGRKPLMVWGTFVGAAGSVMTATASSFMWVLPARLLVGAGSAASMAGSAAYMADLTASVPSFRARIMGIQQAVIATAFIVGPAIGGLLAELYGAQTAFLLVGGAMALSSAGYTLLNETLPEKKSQGVGEAGGRTPHWRELLRCPEQQGLLAAYATLFFGYTAQITVIPLHAAATIGATSGEIGLLFSLMASVGLLGAPLGGYLSDRYGTDYVIIPAAALCSISIVAVGVSSTSSALFPAVVGWGLGASMMHPPLTALAAKVAPPDLRGEALALLRQASDFAFLVGPLLLGLIADWWSCGASLAVSAIAYPIAFSFYASRIRRRKEAH